MCARPQSLRALWPSYAMLELYMQVVTNRRIFSLVLAFWVKVAHYSFPKTKIKILKSVKLKQQIVSSEFLLQGWLYGCENIYLYNNPSYSRILIGSCL